MNDNAHAPGDRGALLDAFAAQLTRAAYDGINSYYDVCRAEIALA
jgi:hypothetical protein